MRLSNIWILISLIVAAYSVWYGFHDHTFLAKEYQNDPRYLYQSSTFVEKFFTPATKHFGNIFCTVVSLGCLAMAYYYHKKNHANEKVQLLPIKWTLSDAAIICVCGLACVLTNTKAPISTDEVFSAYVIGGQSFWKIISYYPLPNHHVLFNVINKVFSILTDDPILSGRILSSIFYLLSTLVVHRMLNIWIANVRISLMITLVVVLQFLPLGFAVQARGYSLYLLLGLLAFYAIYRYYITQNRSYLITYTLACAFGSWCIPSFLYIWFGLGLTILLIDSYAKRWDKHFIITNVKAILLTAVLYLPIITISGWQSLLDNKYVAVSDLSMMAFLSSLVEQRYFVGLWDDVLGVGAWTWLGWILVIMPAMLFFNKSTEYKRFAWYYICILIGLCIMVLAIGKAPFYRNLIFHSVIIWIGIVILLSTAITKSRYTELIAGIFALATLVFTYQNFDRRMPFHLYYTDMAAMTRCDKTESKPSLDLPMAIHSSAFYRLPCMTKSYTNLRMTDSTNVVEKLLLIETEDIDSSLMVQWQKVSESNGTTLLSRR